MRKILEMTEEGFAVLSLILFSSQLLPLILSGGISPGDGRAAPHIYPLIQSVFFVIYFLTFCLMVNNWKKIVSLFIKEKFILIILVLAFISATWSQAPLATLRRSLALAGTAMFGAYFATRYSDREQLKLLGRTFSVIIVLSFFFALIFPEFGIMGGPGPTVRWRGIYTHKNHLGHAMMLGAAVFLLLAAGAEERRLWTWVGFILSLVLLVLSTSKSALINLALILSILCVFWARQKYFRAMCFALVAAVLLVACFSFQVFANFHAPAVLTKAISFLSNPVTESTDTVSAPPNTPPAPVDPDLSDNKTDTSNTVSVNSLKTLTGRTKLWAVMWEMIWQHPWLGYGYGGFWRGWKGPSAYIWQNMKPWKPWHGHNGLLDLWLELGLFGVLIFLMGFLAVFIKTVVGIRRDSTPQDLFPFVYLLCFVLPNLTESYFLRRDNIFFLLYAAIALSKRTNLSENRP